MAVVEPGTAGVVATFDAAYRRHCRLYTAMQRVFTEMADGAE